mmetsp:Transcript_14307/g.44784  ORF Transcript_14307/g.44784 Transcript_14307/m.44784 type:complete len:211 (-) Transcript_14307:2097-2729(-)
MCTLSLSKFTSFSLKLICLCKTRFAALNWLSSGRRLVPGRRPRKISSQGSCPDPSQTSLATTRIFIVPVWTILSSTTSTTRATRPSGKHFSVHSPCKSSSDKSCSGFAAPLPNCVKSTLLVVRNLPNASTLRPMGAGTKLQTSLPMLGAVSVTFLAKHSSSVSHEKNLVLFCLAIGSSSDPLLRKHSNEWKLLVANAPLCRMTPATISLR